MIKKITYCIALVFLSASAVFAQNGSITGSVKTADGQPAELVGISVKGTAKGALTNKGGNYQIKNITPGSYTIVASFIGLGKQEQSVDVKPGETKTVNFVMKENSAQLQEVIVSTKKSKKINTFVAKMPLKNLENPQVYNSVSSEIIKQQGITSYDDALRNVPGINRTWESTGRAGDGGSYFALRGFDAQPSLINGLPGLTSGNLDLADVEEIQVIKGPSATLFGASFYGYGGVINTITKKPYFDFGGEVAYTVGSYGLNRVTADINTPLSKKQKIALRLNTAYQTENSFQNAGFKKSFFIAPAITYEVNDKLSFQVLAEVLKEKRAVNPIFFHSDRVNPLLYKNVEELNLNYRESFMSNDLPIKNPRFNVQAQMLYKMSSKWNSQTVFSAGTVKSDGYYTYIWDDEYGDNYFNQYFHNEQQRTRTIDVQQNFNGDFHMGKLRNRLLVGLDYFNRNVADNGSGWASVRHVTPQQAEVEYTDTSGTTPPIHLTRSLVDDALAATEGTKSNISNSIYSVYVSDVINFTPGLMAMLSLRGDHFVSKGEVSDPTDDYHQTAFSPKLGLVYQPVLDKVSIFANYMNAFVNIAPSQVFDDENNFVGVQSFKPEHANQWEFGVKSNLLSDKLNVTVSYYNIKVSDRVYSTQNGSSVQGGAVRSKGFEIDANANPAPGLNLLAGYSHNSNKVVEGDATDFYNEPGRAPGGQGPQDQANLWATYKFVKGDLKNFGLGVGGNYAGKYRVIDNSLTGVFDLPSYTLLNASVFYNADKYRVTFNLNNITDKHYYIGYWSVNPQKLRNFALSFAYKF
ncbi:TonB-dependent receptor [Mucilaginibacter sabulilitoris]|uniref:TonB-dependent receptor n=1 Tax=Mucilaginibacter sabulilitoris TaxID=1173583 RepID=A0ABZ0TSM4_9SPHI|nr:TonB-dependent receptor [Mucilaginibacter sabulilitoris]WPU96118.1 TonB-dependent receptor [Mucilaginibacter sabulilitoris]